MHSVVLRTFIDDRLLTHGCPPSTAEIANTSGSTVTRRHDNSRI
jgi:hypothetical protein